MINKDFYQFEDSLHDLEESFMLLTRRKLTL